MSDYLEKQLKKYLSDGSHLREELVMRADAIAAGLGFELLPPQSEHLRIAVDHFQLNCSDYWATLGVDGPSHLKIYAHLLYALTQLEHPESGKRLSFFGISRDDIDAMPDEDKRFGYFFHEYCCFLIVHRMLCFAQKGRKVPLNFSHEKVPNSPKYAHSMVRYLCNNRNPKLQGSRSPYDLYMIFKTMDLYGLTENTGL